jgi:Protein of unknown function (DUF1573)
MRFLLCALAFLSCSPVFAGSLQWQSTDLQLAARPGQDSMRAVFAFRNAGDRPVRILGLDPSCSCVSAEADKDVHGPGESGEIRVDLALAGYVGRMHRSIAVTTDDPKEKFTELTLTVDIPESVTITPRFLYWRVGDPPEEKTADIALADPKTAKVGKLECANPHFQAQLSPRKTGGFRLVVKPADTRQPDEASLHLNVIVEGRSQTFVVYVAVK